MKTTIAISILCGSLAHPAEAAERSPVTWPQFRGPNSQGVADAEKPPAATVLSTLSLRLAGEFPLILDEDFDPGPEPMTQSKRAGPLTRARRRTSLEPKNP